MRICLHIGKPRTGTTSFQNGMADNRSRLAEQGIVYPSTDEADRRHMQLFWAAAGARRLRRLRPWHLATYDGMDLEGRVASTLAEASGAHSVVLSSEWFSMAFGAETFRPLIEALRRHGDVTTYVTLRHQADAIVSIWRRQVLDRVNVGPLAEMTAVKGDWGLRKQPMNHLALVRNWSRLCPVVPLAYGPDAPDTLAAAMGIDGLKFGRDPQGPPLELCEYLRSRSRQFATKQDWMAFVARVAEDPAAFAAHRNLDTLEQAKVLRARMTKAYARSNALLAEEFGCVVEQQEREMVSPARIERATI